MVTYRDVVEAEDPVSLLLNIDAAGQLEEYFPELAALKMPIPKGYHHKDNFLHSLQVLENAITLEAGTPDPLLRIAALTHDVGKAKTRRFEGKGKVTFWNHETVGAKQMRPALQDLYPAAFVNDVSHLIKLHMRAYGFGDVSWTDSAVRRLMVEAGSEEQLTRLVKIFYSDLTTANAKKKRKVESGIARLEEAFMVVKEKDARANLRPALDGNMLMEVTGLPSGRDLGRMMKYLNSDEGIKLSEEEAWAKLKALFPEYFTS